MTSPHPAFDADPFLDEVEPAPRQMTVSQLNGMIRRVLQQQMPAAVTLVAEVSNLTRPSSGHIYLTLKDERSEIKSVMWRSAAAGLKFDIEDGMEVLATGNVDVYEPRGQYQFYIRQLEPRGIGALELAFRQLHDRLAREGLFDPEHKQPIPRFPRRIAVVTSPTGAAIRDILKTLRRRFPCVSVLLHPVRVQGDGAAQEIAAAIRRINEHAETLGGIDVMIVGRGGGSLEDLWAFNEEVVARAIFASRIPIISGVGHEIDTTIADLVADLRAPTPTAAAELAVPVLEELLAGLAAQAGRLRQVVRHRFDLACSKLEGARRSEWFRDPLTTLRRTKQSVDEIQSRLQLNLAQLLTGIRHRLHGCQLSLMTISPGPLLDRKQGQLREAMHQLALAGQATLRRAERQVNRSDRGLALASPLFRARVAAERLNGLRARLEATREELVLARGFSILRTKRGRRVITAPRQVREGETVVTQTAGGEIQSKVTDSRQMELFE